MVLFFGIAFPFPLLLEIFLLRPWPHPLVKILLGKMIRYGKIKILHPQKHLISYGYNKELRFSCFGTITAF